MNLSESLSQIKTIFLDTAPVIYFIEAHDQYGPLVSQVVECMNDKRVEAFTSVLTITEVLPKPVESGNNELDGIKEIKILVLSNYLEFIL